MRPSKGGINTNILCKFMLHMIIENMYGSSIITKKMYGIITRNTKISQQPSKPYNLRSGGSKCSKFCLCTGPRYRYLFLGLPCKRRRTKKNAITSDRTTICQITCSNGGRVSKKLKRTITGIKQTLR